MIALLNIFILAFGSLLTLSFLPHLKILGVVPLLPLYFIIQLAYFRKGFEPFLIAAFAGIIFDLYSSYPFGFYLLFFLLTATIVRFFFGEGMRTLSFWHYLILVLLAVIAYLISQTVMIMMAGVKLHLSGFLPYLYGIIVNLVGATLFYPLGIWYFDQLPQLENQLKRR